MTARDVVEDHFPKLRTDSYRVTSPQDRNYNCVAWIARDIRRWWEPDGFDGSFWPVPALEEGSLNDYLRGFASLGFEECSRLDLESGFEKIAVYGTPDEFVHVAFQLDGGSWSSKLGQGPDIRHELLDSLAGTRAFEYGDVLHVMRRPRQPHELADAGLLLP